MSTHLKLYLAEEQKHRGELLYEWILEKAKALGIPGGTAFRAIAGFGRHGNLREEGFFELAGNLPVVVEFFLEEEKTEELLELLKKEKLALFYAKSDVTFGAIGEHP